MSWSSDVEPALKRAKQEILERYGDDPEVTGAGIGIRMRGGLPTEEPVVVVGVATKRSEGSISRRRLLPKTVQVDGQEWGVDVIETGLPTALTAPVRAGRPLTPVPSSVPLVIPDRVRPPRQGCSVNNLQDLPSSTGTGSTPDARAS
jgi:hypothetical protein